ncbi:SRPBCC family protein [Paenibacillus sp. SC116]|uniref:SRPBCC family protein n=1 Tax=Paenibacillus sp. SC116 TaxID=2968986 RepID=UPI00215AF903|nr:SRPBCC family protein [Paenibacillus sp. SC116]MCR8846349.1 SRPBCC family protein [Paenibacillus sp. SC116]
MQIIVSTEIKAPVERIFKALNDEEEIKRWSKMVIGYIFEREEDRNQCYPGLTYITVQKQFGQVLEVKARIIESNLPHKVVARATVEDYIVTMTYAFDKQGEVVKVTQLQEYDIPSGKNRILFLLTSWISRLMLQKEMDRLKKYLEANSHAE